MFDDNNDPIKTYGRSKFSRLFKDDDLSGGTENKYEYDGNDESNFDEYEDETKAKPTFTINEYGINRTRGLSINTLLGILFMIFFIVMMVSIFSIVAIDEAINGEHQKTTSQKVLSPKEKNEELLKKQQEIAKQERKWNEYNFYNLDSINFDQGISIPTIYKYMSQVPKLQYQKYRYSDKRFGNGLTTIEIIYENNFLEKDINNYIQALQRKNYFLKNVNHNNQMCFVRKEPNSDIFIMIIIEENRIVYGVGTGYYADYVNENKNTVYAD